MITALAVWNMGDAGQGLIAPRGSGSQPEGLMEIRAPLPIELSEQLLRAGVWQDRPKPGDPISKKDQFVGPPKPVLWEYLASIRGAPSFVILRSDAGEIKAFEEGKRLPNGLVLVKVEMDSVAVRAEHSRKSVIIPTYRMEMN